jgi:glycosyltransferase involved in cell wall biosynthesis
MKLAILGTVGLPNRYGGWETLADNLVRYSESHPDPDRSVTVYCTARAYPEKAYSYHGATLRYSRLNANGVQSIPYDAITMFDAAFRRHDRLLLLGVSGAVALPLLRLFTRAKIVTNVDGIEWRRNKWSNLAKRFLKWSEALAVRYSHTVIADNAGIAEYLKQTYGIDARVIAYGGDQALEGGGGEHALTVDLPDRFTLALCRIEPENNVEMILEAFSEASMPLVFVGNWNNSEFGRELKARFAEQPNLHLLDPIYDPAELFALRSKAVAYVHGHSVGGTNPSLVEMMHFGIPVLAFDCVFNRHTTDNEASYFADATSLTVLVEDLASQQNGDEMRRIANEKYRWETIGEHYFALLAE